jgi:hypothetical protein
MNSWRIRWSKILFICFVIIIQYLIPIPNIYSEIELFGNTISFLEAASLSGPSKNIDA